MQERQLLSESGRRLQAMGTITLTRPQLAPIQKAFLEAVFFVCLRLNVGRCDHEAHEWATSTHPSIRGSGPFSDSLSDFNDVCIVSTYSM